MQAVLFPLSIGSDRIGFTTPGAEIVRAKCGKGSATLSLGELIELLKSANIILYHAAFLLPPSVFSKPQGPKYELEAFGN